MTRPTEVIIVLDRSGSMASIREAAVRGVNGFIDEVQKEPGEGYWTLVQFDDHDSARGAAEAFPHVVFDRVPDARVPRLEVHSFVPRGSTALNDAVCLTVTRARERWLTIPEHLRPRVMVVVMTDGLENASRQFSGAQLRHLTAEVQAQHGWSFVFLGANQDAFAESAKLGIHTQAHGGVANKINYTATVAGVAAGMAAGARHVRGWKGDGNPTADQLLGGIDPDPPTGDPAKTPGKR
ncbi:MAG: vWA domain-containing protein [Gemmataceae bacterium]